MKNTKFTLALMLAMPCAMNASDNKDLEKAKFILEQYNQCIANAKHGYDTVHQYANYKSSNNTTYDAITKELANEVNNCSKILTLGENDNEIQKLKEEIALLKSRVSQCKKHSSSLGW